MKHFTTLLLILLGFNSYAQFDFNSYENATLTLRNGEVLEGEAKITNEERVKFRDGNDKKTFNYRNLKRFTIRENGNIESYVFKIIAGKEPRLMKVIIENDGNINLYAIEYNNSNNNSGQFPAALSSGVSIDVTEYYANKDDGHEVIKIGNNHPIFGKRHFKKTISKFFKDCPQIISKVENNELKRNDMIKLIDYYNQNCGES